MTSVGGHAANPLLEVGRPRPSRPPRCSKGAIAGWSRSTRPRHLDEIWAANGGHDHIWTWMPAQPPQTREAYGELLAMMAAKAGIVPFAMIDKADGKAKGHLWLMEIRPEHGVFEVGYITYSPSPAEDAGRDRGDLSLRRLWLLARLSPLRVEVQQPERALASAPRCASASSMKACSASTWS